MNVTYPFVPGSVIDLFTIGRDCGAYWAGARVTITFRCSS